jgi:hypothetical protein
VLNLLIIRIDTGDYCCVIVSIKAITRISPSPVTYFSINYRQNTPKNVVAVAVFT